MEFISLKLATAQQGPQQNKLKMGLQLVANT